MLLIDFGYSTAVPRPACAQVWSSCTYRTSLERAWSDPMGMTRYWHL